MIVAWMGHMLLVSALLAAAAWCAERALRLYRLPARFVWVAALAGSAVVPFLVQTRREAVSPILTIVGIETAAAGDAVTGPTATAPGWTTALEAARSLATDEWLNGALGWIWLTATAGGLLLFALTLRRLSRARNAFESARAAGEDVLIAPLDGPAVFGLLRPSIVVPRWLLEMDGETQRLAVLHEREHIRARDPWLLAFSFVVRAVLPWNPVVWWQARRMRAAIEVDCDRRVLGHGASARAYGDLLLRIAGSSARVPLAAAALVEPRTFLEGRIMAMGRKHVSFRSGRFLLLSALALGAAVIACETEAPSAVPAETAPEFAADRAAAGVERAIATNEVEAAVAAEEAVSSDAVEEVERVAEAGMSADVLKREIEAAAAQGRSVEEKPVFQLTMLRDGRLIMNGREIATNELAHLGRKLGEATKHLVALLRVPSDAPVEDVERIVHEIRIERGPAEVRIVRYVGEPDIGEATTADAASKAELERGIEDAARVEEARTRIVIRERDGLESPPRPLIFIDGVELPEGGCVVNGVVRARNECASGAPDGRVDPLGKLDPAAIDRIEVVKGVAAEGLYGKRGVAGVIRITTKAPAARKN